MIRKRGFTLVEVMTVVIIIGILATIAVPVVRGRIKRAILTEAVTALGTIRTAERMYYVEYGCYQGTGYFDTGDRPSGISEGDLDGTYFSEGCYYVSIPSGESNKFYAYCDTGADRNQAPKKQTVLNLIGTPSWIRMDQSGVIEVYQIPGCGYPEFEE